MGNDRVEAISNLKNTDATNSKYSLTSYDRDQWLEGQWKQGATVWTLSSFAGGGVRS